MPSRELLLELLSEEIPARMQRRAIDDLVGLVRDKLAASEIAASAVRGYVTPRRLTVTATGIPERQPDRSEERRGPRVGAPPQALDGFLRSAGLQSVEQCEVRDTGRGEFYFALVQHAGRPSAEVLPELLQAAFAEMPWPKTMRFPAAPLRWVRPLNSIICLFDGDIVPLAVGEVPVGRTTRGHRFMSPGEFTVENAADYREKLESASVILDPDRRRDIIAADLDRLARAEGLTVKPDPGLLDEVTGLVEFPVVLMGTIDDASMELPPEVLATAMRTHQKYFFCLKPDGTPAPRFLFVANNLTPDDGKTIIAGNERVLKARLADARFFWDQDRKIRLEDRVEALKGRVYYEKVGTVYDKVSRVEKLSTLLKQYVPGNWPVELVQKAARLAKADLSTDMVGEFPELQGVMGRYYALHDGADRRIADAIAEHYKPLGPSDTCPTAPVSVVVALADKLDSLAAFFAIDERPTGSRDPFALRRAAQGVIRLILENDLRVPLRIGLSHAIRLVRERTSASDHEIRGDLATSEALSSLIDFIFDRLRVHLRDQGFEPDVIAAARMPGRVEETGASRAILHEDDLTRFVKRLLALRTFLESDDGANLLTAYRRASNIVAIEESRDKLSYELPVDTSLFQQQEETAVYQRLNGMGSTLEESFQHEQFDRAMARLATLRRPVDEFFDKVTVNVDEPELRQNRLRLLSRIRAVMNQVADFSHIEG